MTPAALFTVVAPVNASRGDGLMIRTHMGIVLSIVALVVVGCRDARSPSTPSTQPAVQQPSPNPTGVQPTIRTMAPRIGSTRGGAWVTITGTDFQPGATVKLGEVGVTTTVLDVEAIAILTPAHLEGTVDVIVTNPGGLADTLAGGYAYAPPETFDFNGDWVAHVGAEFELDMRFTIRNNVLVNLSCDKSPPLALAPAPPVRLGEFSFQSDDGVRMSGLLVSPVNAVGTIDLPAIPGCRAARWWADKE